MIRIELPWMIFVYLLIFLSAIFLIWIACETARRKLDRRASRHRLQCKICGLQYEDSSEIPLPKCPRCGSQNERSRPKIY